jgi:hypothetical protein
MSLLEKSAAVFLVNQTVEEAADALSKRAHIARELQAMDKEGLSLDDIGGLFKNNPGITATLAGAAGGAGVGGISSLFRNKEDRDTGGSMLTGALAGGALGGGGYLAARHFSMPQGRDASGGIFQQDGETKRLSPEAVKSSPELLTELDSLRDRSWLTRTVGATQNAMGDYIRANPIIAALGFGDAASHTLGAASRVSGGTSLAPKFLREGVMRAIASGEESKEGLITLRELKGMTDDKLQDLLARVKAGPKHFSDFGGKRVGNDLGSVFTAQDIQDLTDKGGATTRHGAGGAMRDLFSKAQQAAKKVTGKGLLGDKGHSLSGTGYTPSGKRVPSFWKGKFLRALERGPKSLAGLGAKGRLGSRAALYGGIPAIMAYLGIAGDESDKENRISEIINQLSTPAK